MNEVMPLKEMTEATCLYDNEGNLVGKWVPETGRGIFADCFVERINKRTCHDISDTYGIFKCSECLCTVKEEGVDYGCIFHCPDCGLEVVSE